LAKQFQRRRFLEIDQSKTRIACGGHVCKWIKMKLAISIEDKKYHLNYQEFYYYMYLLKESLKKCKP
jgi:hypothetical protein